LQAGGPMLRLLYAMLLHPAEVCGVADYPIKGQAIGADAGTRPYDMFWNVGCHDIFI